MKATEIPLYYGARKPLNGKEAEDADDFHGEKGLSPKVQDYFKKTEMIVKSEKGKTIEDLYDGLMALEEKVTYVVTGPATTLAR